MPRPSIQTSLSCSGILVLSSSLASHRSRFKADKILQKCCSANVKWRYMSRLHLWISDFALSCFKSRSNSCNKFPGSSSSHQQINWLPICLSHLLHFFSHTSWPFYLKTQSPRIWQIFQLAKPSPLSFFFRSPPGGCKVETCWDIRAQFRSERAREGEGRES